MTIKRGMTVQTVKQLGLMKSLLPDSSTAQDCVRTVSKKPIALITDYVPYAVHWALTNLKNVDTYSASSRTLATKDGQKYIICSKPEHLIAVEIADYRDVGGNQKPASFFINMIKLAQTRMR